jgi:hypothetical protein
VSGGIIASSAMERIRDHMFHPELYLEDLKENCFMNRMKSIIIYHIYITKKYLNIKIFHIGRCIEYFIRIL